MLFAANTRFHRFLTACVVALLTGNAFAIALIAADDVTNAAAPHELTLITTADGHRYLVDPSTPAGRQAIEDAKHNGSTLTNVPAPPTSSTAVAARNSNNPLPTLPPVNGVLPIDPGSALDQTINNILNTVTSVSSVVGGVVTSVSSVLDDTQSTLANVSTTIDGVVTTVSTGVDNVSTTVANVVTTLQNTVTTLQTTVTTLLNNLNNTATTITSPTTVKAADPVCGLLHC